MANSETDDPPPPKISSSIGVTIIPKKPVPIAPYANATYTQRSTSDVTMIFLRVPLLTDDDAKTLFAEETKILEGDYIGSIVLPLDAAKDLADRLLVLVGAK